MQVIQPRTVGILIFDEVEVLDFCGPFEVFSVAQAVEAAGDRDHLFRAVTIAEENRIVTCRGGLLVQPHATIDNHPALDILVVPGGQGTRREITNTLVLDWITAQDTCTELTTSVCTGAFLLAECGLLNGRRATTHWASITWMREKYPAIETIDTERVVDEGHLITSAGVSAGIDMALHVVTRLHGVEVAARTARTMEYEGDAGARLPTA